MKKYLLKASEERDKFYDLLNTEVTFRNDIIDISGNLMHEKGDKVLISDVIYTEGFWSNLCPDIYVSAKISSFKINGISGVTYNPLTFIEHQTPPKNR